MPTPPIQFIRLRHMRIAWGSFSTSSMSVAPLPVNPLMLSNSASTGLEKVPFTSSGTAPARAAAAHVTVTEKKPSRARSGDWLRRRPAHSPQAPRTTETAPGTARAREAPSPYPAARIAHTSMPRPAAAKAPPTTGNTMPQLSSTP